MSSVIVLWRFYVPGKMTKEREEELMKREERASMGISFILVLLGIGVMAAALDDLGGGPESPKDLKVVLYISLVSIFVFGSLTVVKFRYANKLNSPSLYKDGICSLIGTSLAAALFVNTLIIDNNPSVWWLDPVVSIIGGLVALVIGMHALVVASCVEGIPIFTVHWWFVSQGDGEGTSTGGETEMQSEPADQDEKPLSDLV
jgi:peptidoglycan/LPS O-acetylase OafA/YrhL